MFVKLCWVVTAVASAIGLLILFSALGNSNSAPQQAAGAGMAIACAAIPYIFTRCMEGILRKDRQIP
jgi:ABC-type spermidine/putrescine transport system permease subunit II